jgi:hypothetical protein
LDRLRRKRRAVFKRDRRWHDGDHDGDEHEHDDGDHDRDKHEPDDRDHDRDKHEPDDRDHDGTGRRNILRRR